MSKSVTKFICEKCGAEFPKWQGQCGQCGEWNSLVETVVSQTRSKINDIRSKIDAIKPLKLSEIKSRTFSRVKTGIGELDRVLGGGIVPGSVVLVAGEPGIGKSTLLTQLALNLTNSSSLRSSDKNYLSLNRARKSDSKQSTYSRDTVNAKTKQFLLTPRELHNSEKSSLYTKYSILNTVLYVCGEESPEQIKLRIQRIVDLRSKSNDLRSTIDDLRSMMDNLLFLPETNIENILQVIEQLVSKQLREKEEKNPNHLVTQSLSHLVIIDSVQTLWTENLTGTAGSVGQVRECSNMLLTFAKKTNIPVFLIGHITKEGTIAGPKVLEHLVDTVLYLEGEREHDFRILRTTKNRFGPTDEVGIFRMSDKGMEEVADPSAIFLSPTEDGRHLPAGEAGKMESGKAVTVAIQGIRPMLVQIEALVVPSNLAMPRRVASGISFQKLQVLCAVLQKKLGLALYQSDVFVNVAGGLKLTEPAADLAIAMAIVSSVKNKPLALKSVVVGELGLLGEIRKVSFWERRIKEARKLGYKTIIGEKEKDLRQTLKYLQ